MVVIVEQRRPIGRYDDALPIELLFYNKINALFKADNYERHIYLVLFDWFVKNPRNLIVDASKVSSNKRHETHSLHHLLVYYS